MEIYKTTNKIEDARVLEFKDVIFHKDIVTDGLRDISLFMLLQTGSGVFEILLQGTSTEELVTSGIIREIECEPDVEYQQVQPVQNITTDEIYSELANAGHKHAEELKLVNSLAMGEKGKHSYYYYSYSRPHVLTIGLDC